MTIRFAEYSDSDRIIEFIRRYWNENHIFVKNPEVFDYCHKNTKRLTYVIAEEDGQIYGICGYINANSLPEPDIWAALWKVIPSPTPFLGLKIMNFLITKTHSRHFACCGIVPDTFKLYRLLKCRVDEMEFWYWLNCKEKYSIADIREFRASAIVRSENKGIKMDIYTDWDSLVLQTDPQALNQYIPYKDNNYLRRKYFGNIKYRYNAVLISDEKEQCIVFGRQIECNGSKVFKITDIIGNEELLGESGCLLCNWFVREDYEYVYLYQYGINEGILNKAGFTKRTDNDPNIFPNYFEPFERKNVDIFFSSDTLNNFRMFSGDGDQDRPNLM